jgi:RNA polymerase sigma-70 factor (ECF subfamily)
MTHGDLNQRLSQITTRWSLVFQAHQGPPEERALAGQVLLQRYCGAIYRYLLAALRDADDAQEVAQEFALAFVRGDFRSADPERGRFRDYVRTSLFHLVVNHQRRRQRLARLRPLPPDSPALAVEGPGGAELDREFLRQWREELLDRAWESLERFERRTGQAYYTVLRFRAEHPQLASAELADRLTARDGKPLTAAGVRQTLHRAREKYAEMLVEEVARSLQTTEPERVEQELIDLGLLEYCRPAVVRHVVCA